MEGKYLSNIDLLATIIFPDEEDNICKEHEIVLDSEKNFIELFESFVKVFDYISRYIRKGMDNPNKEYQTDLEVLGILPSEYDYKMDKETKKIISDGLINIYKKISSFFKENEFNLSFTNNNLDFTNEIIREHRYYFKNFRNSMEKIEALALDLNKNNKNRLKQYKKDLYKRIERIKDDYKDSRDKIGKQKKTDYSEIKEYGHKNEIYYLTYKNAEKIEEIIKGIIIAKKETPNNKSIHKVTEVAKDTVNEDKTEEDERVFEESNKEQKTNNSSHEMTDEHLCIIYNNNKEITEIPYKEKKEEVNNDILKLETTKIVRINETKNIESDRTEECEIISLINDILDEYNEQTGRKDAFAFKTLGLGR